MLLMDSLSTHYLDVLNRFIEVFRPSLAKVAFAHSKNSSPGGSMVEASVGRGEAVGQFLSRPEVIRLISTLLGLTTSCAVAYYSIRYLVEHMDPTKKEMKSVEERARQVLSRLGIQASSPLTSYELVAAADLIDPSSISTSWKDIGGLDHVIAELKENVVFPFKHPHITRSSKLLQAPKGILLFGPPGCGKTLVAKAVAREVGATLINLQLTSLLDKWYGESQKRTEALFSLAAKFQPVIIFIDEIDSFLSSRDHGDQEATSMIKTQFMTLWDGLCTDPEATIIVMGATNRRHAVDPAILRRMPCQLFIGLPSAQQRENILKVILAKERNVPVTVMERLEDIAKATDGFSGSDLVEVCRMAAINRLKSLGYFTDASPGADDDSFVNSNCLITYEDIISSVRKLRQSRVSSAMDLLPSSSPM